MAHSALGSSLANTLTLRRFEGAIPSRACKGRIPVPRRKLQCRAKGDEQNEYVNNRTENQKKLAALDGAIRRGRDELGKSIMQNFETPLSWLGMGKSSTGPKKRVNQWDEQFEYLISNTKSVDASEVKVLMEKGYVFIDVRPNDEYEAYHPVGAKSVPLYQTIEGASAKQLLRKSLYAMQAVKPVEENPDFIKQAKACIGEAPGVVVGCGAGGTLQATTNFPTGQASRSLISIHKILTEGVCPEALHLRGGLNSWFREGLEGEGADAEWDDTSGRTPYVAGFTPEQDSDELKVNQ